MTTAYPPATPPRVPGRRGYVVAGLLLVATVVAATVLGVVAVRGIARGADINPVSSDGQFTVGGEPVAVYVDGFARRRTCTATPVDGGSAADLVPRGGTVSVNLGGHHWQRIGTLPDGTAPGAYALACRPGTTAEYGTGRLFAARQIVLGIAGAALVAVVGLSLAGAFGLVTLLRRSHRRTRAAAGAYVPPGGRR